MSEKPLETAITKAIMDYLKTLKPDGWFFKTHGGPWQRMGIPDILGVYRRHFVALEVKRPGGKATPLQEHTIGMIQAAGGVAEVVLSAEEVKGIIDRIGGVE